MSRGYDSLEYLETYRRHKSYPTIHRDLFGLVVDRSRSSRFLDLACSTGLLGQRLRAYGVAEFVLGLDAEHDSIRAAREYGVSIPMSVLDIRPDTLAELGSLITVNRITAVVARRCFPEILGNVDQMDSAFADTLAKSGVTQLFVEGRQVSVRSSHRLSSVENEIAAVSTHYEPMTRRGNCVYLVVKPERVGPADLRAETRDAGPCSRPADARSAAT